MPTPLEYEQLAIRVSNAWASKRRDVVAGDIPELGASTCPYCVAFHTGETNCVGCPVAESTGYRFCSGTPYDHVDYLADEVLETEAYLDDPELSKDVREQLKEDLAESRHALLRQVDREIDFLNSLREDWYHGC